MGPGAPGGQRLGRGGRGSRGAATVAGAVGPARSGRVRPLPAVPLVPLPTYEGLPSAGRGPEGLSSNSRLRVDAGARTSPRCRRSPMLRSGSLLRLAMHAPQRCPARPPGGRREFEDRPWRRVPGTTEVPPGGRTRHRLGSTDGRADEPRPARRSGPASWRRGHDRIGTRHQEEFGAGGSAREPPAVTRPRARRAARRRAAAPSGRASRRRWPGRRRPAGPPRRRPAARRPRHGRRR